MVRTAAMVNIISTHTMLYWLNDINYRLLFRRHKAFYWKYRTCE